jgi:threonine/homoserine/homoserine lactone efflux protein
MPSATTLLLFSGASLLLLIVPGPAVTYIVARSVAHGRRAGLISVLGIHAGSIVHVVAAVVGVSALIASSAATYHSLRLLGAAYLIYLGLSRFFKKSGESIAEVSDIDMRRIFMQGMIVNILNPKTSLFFLAFLPQFVDPAGNVPLQTVVFGLTFIALGAISDGAYALAASSFARLMRRNRRFVTVERLLSAGTLIALGIWSAAHGQRPQTT